MSTLVTAPTREKRLFKPVGIGIAALLLCLVAGLAFYLRSDSFRRLVQQKIVAELERTTGGKVEIESLTWKLSRLRFEVRGLTIHGHEGPGNVPYAHADRVLVEGRVVSLISHKLALQKVDIDHLTVHLIIYSDGSTNQPSPRAGARGAELPGQRLFDLAINEIEVKNGTLLLNQERIPFEIKGEDLAAGLSYSRKEAGYEGEIAMSLLSARWRGLAPQRGDVALHILLRDNQAEIQSLKVATGRSTLSNYNSPALDLRYTATLDLAEMGRLEELQELRAGTSQISGSVHYASGDYSSKGSLSFHNLEWKEDTVHAAAIEGSFLFSLTPVRLSFTRLGASLLGGRLRGEVQITNWSRTRRAQQKGTADLQITGLQVAKLTEVVA
ncbi:MAG: AsmA family protein, partial [Candidatus Angelobacter sp.]